MKLYTDLVVYWDGTAALCNHDWRGQQGLGDLTGQSIGQVWSSKVYEYMRASHESGQAPDNSTCARCDHWRVSYMPDRMLGELYEKCPGPLTKPGV